MQWSVLFLVVLGVGECGREGRLALHPGLLKTKQPLQIQGNFEAPDSTSEDSKKRNKRAWWDDHGEEWLDKINVTASVLPGDTHGTAFVEWGGTDKNSDVIVILTKSGTPAR